MCTFSYILEQSGLTRSEFARALGVPPSAINTRINGTNDIKISELIKIEEYVGKKLFRESDSDFSDKAVEIHYLELDGIPKECFRDRVVTELYYDSQIVCNRWGYKPENLRCTKMLGDKMAGGDYPLRNEDVLLIDVTQTDTQSTGVYVFTTHNKNVFICGISRSVHGQKRFYFYNKSYDDKILTDEELEKAQFKVIGRVVKNLTLRI